MQDETLSDRKLSIFDLQNHTRAALQKIWEKLHPELNFEEVSSLIRGELDEGEITIDSLADEWFIYVTKPNNNNFLTPFRHACIYLEKSRRSLNANNLEEALESAKKAAKRTIIAAGHASGQGLENPSLEIRKRRAHLGGLKINEKYIPAREEAARLLRQKRPADGWSSVSHAANEISEELCSFIERNEIPLKDENIPETIKRWIKKNPLLSAAFNENKSSKSKHSGQ